MGYTRWAPLLFVNVVVSHVLRYFGPFTEVVSYNFTYNDRRGGFTKQPSTLKGLMSRQGDCKSYEVEITLVVYPGSPTTILYRLVSEPPLFQ